MRVVSFLLFVCFVSLVVADYESPSASSSTGAAAITISNPPVGSVSDRAKSTPGRHCELRSGCADCLAINYCVWSPRGNKCLDKHKATLADDVVHTCDPDECAKHGGPKPVDRRPVAHVAADIVNSRGRRVVAEAQAVHKLHRAAVIADSHHGHAKHLAGRSFPRTVSDDAHVVIKPGKRRMVFSSDNNAPIIKGEREERRRRYLREKREHARQMYEREICRRANGCGAPKPKKQYARPEYYPDPKQNRTSRLAQFKADHIEHERELRSTLALLRERADYTLHHRSGMIAAKRRRIQQLLDQVSRSINEVNTQAYAIDHDEAVYQRLHSQVKALEEKVISVCEAPNSAFIELGVDVDADSDSEVDSEVDSELDSESEVAAAAEAEVAAEEAAEAGAFALTEADIAAEAEQQVAAEEAAEAQDFAAAEAHGEAEQTAEQELNNNGELSAEEMEQRVAQLQSYAEYPEPIAIN